MTSTKATTFDNPFTQSWIQSLTLAAQNPVARTIKPTLEWIDRVSTSRDEPDRLAAAQALWDYAHSAGLQDLIWLLPAQASSWIFDREDMFVYQRPTTADDMQPSFQRWTQCLGMEPGSFALSADVTSSDWAGLVRKEAVRLQHSLDTSAVQQASNLCLPCTAYWDSSSWAVRFDQVDWIVVRYEDPPAVARPTFLETQDCLLGAITTANQALLDKRASQCPKIALEQPWQACAPKLRPLHEAFGKQSSSYSPWLSRVWSCVWPVVYREQNVLGAKADVGQIRVELRDCLAAQPRLTMWAFVYAKLVCQLHLGRGLGLLADFCD